MKEDVTFTAKEIRDELEWLRRRLTGHSNSNEENAPIHTCLVSIGYVDARIDDFITSFLDLPLKNN